MRDNKDASRSPDGCRAGDDDDGGGLLAAAAVLSLVKGVLSRIGSCR